MDTIRFPRPKRQAPNAPLPAPTTRSARFEADEIDRITSSLKRELEASCPRCERALAVEGPFVVRDTGDRIMVARCPSCGRSMTARARRPKPAAPSFDNLVVSNPRDRHMARSIPGSILSVGLHGLLIYAAVVATMRVTTAAPEALADTTMVFLTAEEEPRDVQEPERPQVTMAVTPLPRGFQTLDVPIDIPSEIPPVDLGERFDPRDFSGRGVEGGVFAGGEDGAGVSQRHVFEMAAVDEPPQFLSGSAAKYPEALRQAGITGYVTVEFIVDTAGVVDAESIRVLDATRNEFVAPAVEAVRNSRYRPARVRGIPVRVLVSQRIDFNLVRR